MWNKIKGWLAPPIFEDEEDNRVTGLLNGILLTFIILVVPVAAGFLIDDPDNTIRVGVTALLLAISLVAYGVMRLKYIQAAGILFLFGLWLLMTLFVVRIGGVRLPAFAFFVVIIMAAGMLLGTRSVVMFGLLGFASGAIALFAELNDLQAVAYEEYGLDVTGIWIAQTAIILIVAPLSYFTTRSISHTMKRLRHEERELTVSNKKLEAIRGTLEERVAARTRGLELVTTLSERLTGILDFDQLLVELVNQVKEGFDYYHAHIYILDEQRQSLIMTAGVGEAGAQMKAEGHHILLNAPTSLVAQTARTGEIVNVSDVHQSPNALPNPLLPDTCSEMAVPIIVDEQVVGVLDVQQDKIGGFDENDADLLRLLANQVAVAIRNAHLFDEVETALVEAQVAQERYVAQNWQISRSDVPDKECLYTQPGMLELSDATLETAQEQALAQNRPAIVPIDEYEVSPKPLVAPVSLAGQTIGALQLHKTDSEDTSKFWTEQDLEFVETILNQVAQSAENLRLFGETQEQAGREKTIREITDKLRAAPNLERLLEVATLELSQRLPVTHAELELGIETDKEHSTEKYLSRK